MNHVTAPVHDAAAVARLLGITAYTAEQLSAFGPPPDPRPGFVTFLDPGCSILMLRAAVGHRRVFVPQSWYGREAFAVAQYRPCYRQVRTEPVPDSLGKTYADQLALLPADEEVPMARAVVAALVVRFLATGERLLPGVWVRCADQTSDGLRVYVGDFDRDGLSVNGRWDDNRNSGIGLASSRKF